MHTVEDYDEIDLLIRKYMNNEEMTAEENVKLESWADESEVNRILLVSSRNPKWVLEQVRESWIKRNSPKMKKMRKAIWNKLRARIKDWPEWSEDMEC